MKVVGSGNDPVSVIPSGLFWYSKLGVTDPVSEFEITATENGNSNRTTGSLYTPNGSIPVLLDGQSNPLPRFDDDGNMLYDHLWTYTWNSENRLVVLEHRDDITLTPLARKKMEFAYDSQGRRFQKKVYEEVSGSWVLQEDVRFVYDGWNLLAEIDANGMLVRDYVWGQDLSGGMQGAGGVGGLLSVDDGTTVGLAVYDGNGNVMGYTDSSAGNLVAEYEYDPFGRLILSLGAQADAFVHRFSTKYQDEESGYYYYGFRYYDPEIGRWLNRDPIEERGGYNLYGYVGNNGVYDYDYLGLWDIMGYLRGEQGWIPGHGTRKKVDEVIQSGREKVLYTADLGRALGEGFMEGLSAEGRLKYWDSTILSPTYRTNYLAERWSDPTTISGQLVSGDIYGYEVWPAPGFNSSFSLTTGRLSRVPGFAKLIEGSGTVGIQGVYIPDECSLVFYLYFGGGHAVTSNNGPQLSLDIGVLGVYDLHNSSDYSGPFLSSSIGGGKGLYSGEYSVFVSPEPSTETGYQPYGQSFNWTITDSREPGIQISNQWQYYYEAGRIRFLSEEEAAKYISRLPKNENGDRIWNPFQFLD